MGILALHVDDFVFCGNYLFQENEIAGLKKYSKLERMKVEHLYFWDYVLGRQNLYILSISPIDIKKGRSLRKTDELRRRQNYKD